MRADNGVLVSARLSLPGRVRSDPDATERKASVVASTRAVDAYDEIVSQDWRLDRYRANPVVLWGHDSSSIPIGYAENVRVSDAGLEADLRFVDAAANPLAEQIYEGVRQGSIRGVSVGFRPGGVEKTKGSDGKTRNVLKSPELIEISVVPIPANPETTIQAVRAMRSDTKEQATMSDEAKATETKAIDCPQCGASNPDGSKYCNACGADLSASTEAAPDTTESEKAIAALQRQVAALSAASVERELEGVAPAQRAALVKLAGGDVAKLREVASVFRSAHAPKERAAASGSIELVERDEFSDREQHVMRAFGLDEKAYLEVRKRREKEVAARRPELSPHQVRAVLGNTALAPIFTSFEAAFDGAFAALPSALVPLSLYKKSDTTTNVYAWLQETPMMREWLGPRYVHVPVVDGYSLTNKPYEVTAGMSKFDIADGMIADYGRVAIQLANAAKALPEQLLANRLIYGDDTSGADAHILFDGKPLFSTTHPIKKGSSTTQSNKLTTTALTAANFASTRAAMRAFKNAGNGIMGIKPTHLIVPPELESTARSICEMKIVQGTSAGIDNVNQGLAQVVVVDALSADSATTWYLASMTAGMSPLVLQERETASFAVSSPDSHEMRNEAQFKLYADWRGVAGATLWPYCIRCEA